MAITTPFALTTFSMSMIELVSLYMVNWWNIRIYPGGIQAVMGCVVESEASLGGKECVWRPSRIPYAACRADPGHINERNCEMVYCSLWIAKRNVAVRRPAGVCEAVRNEAIVKSDSATYTNRSHIYIYYVYGIGEVQSVYPFSVVAVGRPLIIAMIIERTRPLKLLWIQL